MRTPTTRVRTGLAVTCLATAAALAACTAPAQVEPSVAVTQQPTPSAPPASSPAQTGHFSSDTRPKDLAAVLGGFKQLWLSSGKDDLHGTVKDAATLQWNDRLASWINQNATPAQQLRALQDAQYAGADGSGYDQSVTVADGLGQKLGALYLAGRRNGQLPLTSKLLNNTNGSAGKYISTGDLKYQFSYPRPYLSSDPNAPLPAGDPESCAPSKVNASSLAGIRKGKPWADAGGTLKITRVPSSNDTSQHYANGTVRVSGGYRALCTGGSYPSGHSTDAYSSGLTLATLLPELAPSILARTSESTNNRIVLGVHYPLDVIGGRLAGEVGVATRWSDPAFRDQVLLPARKELVGYLEAGCGATLATCIAGDTPYADDPYQGAKLPGGGSQAVSDRASALQTYTERLGYGFTATQKRGLPASVPTGAENLLLTAFPTLTDAQRQAVLAQTEIDSGHPLDTSALDRPKGPGSWQRLNLAAAMSATVKLDAHGGVTVVSVGGAPTVMNG
ncbi:MAG: phosphatase PAP2 family protein [Micropruina sp.]|uniref:phosphatase PAP2 family protein n=1 Tax=Micropruina sp. TaxID=2737536 RepID=UPI0039E24ECD